jgi:AcrR family transcriptional regulator
MQNVTDKRMKRTKIMFHQALLELLQEKSFESISISEIVRKTGVNRGTFYFHYEQKDDLLEEIVKTVLTQMVVAYRKPHKSYQEMTITEISTYPLFEHFIENKLFYQTMLSSSVPIHLHERMLQTMEHHYHQDIDFFLPSISKDVNQDLFCSYRVHGLIGFILNWIKNDFDHPIEYMAEQLVKIVSINTQKIYIKR